MLMPKTVKIHSSLSSLSVPQTASPTLTLGCVCSVATHSLWSHGLWLTSSAVHGILQARKLESVAISFSRGTSQPRGQTQVFLIAGGFFTIWATRESLSLEWCLEKPMKWCLLFLYPKASSDVLPLTRPLQAFICFQKSLLLEITGIIWNLHCKTTLLSFRKRPNLISSIYTSSLWWIKSQVLWYYKGAFSSIFFFANQK